jgi:hypothetical protein
MSGIWSRKLYDPNSLYKQGQNYQCFVTKRIENKAKYNQ